MTVLSAHLSLSLSLPPSLCIHPSLSWVTGEWGKCSVTCGKGLQLRDVMCVHQLQNGSYVNTRDLYCLGGKPSAMQGCDGRDCLTAWEASEWSKVLSSNLSRQGGIWLYCMKCGIRLYCMKSSFFSFLKGAVCSVAGFSVCESVFNLPC